MDIKSLPRNSAGGIDPGQIAMAVMGGDPAKVAQATTDLQTWAAGKPGAARVPGTTKQQSTTTTTKSGPIPEATLLKDADAQIAASDNFTKTLQEAILGVGRQAETTAAQIEAVGAAQAKSTALAGESAAANVLAKQEAINAFSASTRDPNSTVVRAIAQREDAFGALNKMKEEIDAASAVSILDDPLTAIVNMVRVPALKRAYNAVAMKANTATAQIDTLYSQAAMAVNLDTGADAQRALAEAGAKAEAEQAQALAQASKLRADALLQQTTLAEMVMKQAGVPLSSRLAVMRALTESTQTAAMTRQGEQVVSAQAKRVKDLEKVNFRRIQMGQPAMDITEFEGMDPKVRDLVVRNAGVSGFATSPGEFYRVLDATGGFNTIETAQPAVAAFMRERMSPTNKSYAKAKAELTDMLAGGAAFSKLSQDQQQEKLLDRAMLLDLAEIRKEKRNYSELDPSNAYFYNKVAAVKQVPELANNWVSKHVAEKIGKDPKLLTQKNPIADQDLLDELNGRVIAATANGNTAEVNKIVQEFSDFYRIGQVKQWERTAMMLGYPKPTEYTMAYNTNSQAANLGLQVWTPSAVLHSVIQYTRKMNAEAAGFQAGFGYVSPKPLYAEPKETK